MSGRLSRRAALKAGGALVVAFGTSSVPEAFAQAAHGIDATPGKPLDVNLVDSFLSVHPDGSVTVYSGKVDLGTGVRIALRQMAAEELDVPVERIALIEGDTALTPNQGGTGGSTTIARGGTQIRQAAATARRGLLDLASARLGVPASELTIEAGAVRARSGKSVTFAALVGGKHFALNVDPQAPLKDPSAYKVVGQPLPRPDVPAKCTGRHTYVHDFTLPNMLHGRVIRPPAIGAKLVSVDESSLAAIPNARVVRTESFLGVVAADEWAAIRAARELKATWTDWQGLPGSDGLAETVRKTPVEREEVLSTRGDSAGAMQSAAKRLSATYFWPVQSHASMGPSCAVADVNAERATIWTASQATHQARMVFSRFLGLAPENVRMIYLDGSGCYGMNGHDDAAADAALLSRAVGRPVRVQWMRADEHGWDPKGPPQLLDLRAGLDAAGRVVAWEAEMWLPAKDPPSVPLLAPDAAGIGQAHGISIGQAQQNADPSYGVANLHVACHWIRETPLRTSNLRSPGKIANVWAVESFTDELAAAAKADPVEFRLRAMTDERGSEVIRRTAALFGWSARPSPRAVVATHAIGRGFAYVNYKHQEGYIALAMEVAVDRSSGQVSVLRVACAHDCGLVINPDGLKNQIEGCVVQTLSRALHEEVTFDRSRVTSVDWSSYRILRASEAPPISIALIDRPTLPPVGAGEAASTPVAGALGNAIFDATGVRLRVAPFTPERVKAALAKA